MSIRKKLNQMPGLISGVVVIAIVAAIWMIWGNLNRGAGHGLPTGDFFSADDGKTFFRDDVKKLPPFDSGGKEAVKAYVYECDGKRFVGLLAKLSSQAQDLIQKERADIAANPSQPSKYMMQAMQAYENGWLYKKPGAQDWVKGGPGYATGQTPKCDNGKPADAVSNR